MGSHDSSRRRLFVHREMVADLLSGFVDEPWVGDLEFETLERVPTNFVSHTFRSRSSDVVWKLRLRGRWLYVYLVLEFQSTINPYMAVRLLVYVGLLYQDLIRSQELPPDASLPLVVPIVLYGGERSWSAPTSLHEMLAEGPVSLVPFQPDIRYLVLQERQQDYGQLAGMNNLVAAMFRLENSPSLESFHEAFAALKTWLSERNQRELAESFVDWLQQVVLPDRLPDVTVPSLHSLEEMQTMLEERSIDWTREWREKGFPEGKKEGYEVGRKEGWDVGREEGRAEGRVEGRVEGRREGEAEILLRQMERKFGPVSDSHRKRVEQAECDQLLQWAERILIADSVEDVLGDA